MAAIWKRAPVTHKQRGWWSARRGEHMPGECPLARVPVSHRQAQEVMATFNSVYANCSGARRRASAYPGDGYSARAVVYGDDHDQHRRRLSKGGFSC